MTNKKLSLEQVLQDKLHQNLCKRRELVAIGTHDLSKLRGPFTYEALPPKDIRFVPLKPAEQDRDFTADELLEYYDEHDRNLRKFNHIIRDSIVYPVLYDADRTVLSLPPIINGAKSAITLQTRDIFIKRYCFRDSVEEAIVELHAKIKQGEVKVTDGSVDESAASKVRSQPTADR